MFSACARTFAAISVLLLSACAGEDMEPGEIFLVEGFAGMVAADEPNTAVVGREVLGMNGTAIDAAVAMAMAMSVTKPSRVNLGGGGVCLAFFEPDRTATALVFPPVAGPQGAVAPVTARAMDLLHARYGIIRWELLLASAENFARFGFPVSRALAEDLRDARGKIAADPTLAATFRRDDGRLLGEGDRLVQLGLSTMISGLRQRGNSYLHSGAVAQRVAESARGLGIPLTAEALRERRPSLVEPLKLPFLDDVLYLPPPPASGGVTTAQLWQMLTEAEDWLDADEDRAGLFATAELRALLDRAAWTDAGGTQVPVDQLLSAERAERLMADRSGAANPAAALPPSVGSDAPSAGFVVADRFGNSVACSMTLNALFGSGRMDAESGLIFAAPPSPDSRNTVPLAIALIGNENTGRFRFAASAGGGSNAPGALVQVMLQSMPSGLMLEPELPLAEAIAVPRLRWTGNAGLTYEAGVPAEQLQALPRWGLSARQAPSPAEVQALFCPLGLRDEFETPNCRVAADPRGDGLAETAR